MFLSFIIPVYNTEKYLSKCLDSIINQDFDDYEIILVDDGSTDNSGKICEEYVNKYDNIQVYHKNNEGQLMSRIFGLKKAKGDYCWFVDSDDYILEGAIKLLFNKVTQYNPDMILFGNKSKSEKKEKINLAFNNEFFLEKDKRLIYERALFTGNFNALWKRIIRRSLVSVTFLSEKEKYNFIIGEDAHQSLLMIDASSTILYIPFPLYVYRINNQGVMKKKYPLDFAHKLYNSQYYSQLLVMLRKWKMESEENSKKIMMASLINWICVFGRIYRNLETTSERKKCMNYNWEGLLMNNELSLKKQLGFVYKFEYMLMKKKKIFLASIYYSLKKIMNRLFRQR